jgi:hypothetical protein
MVFNTAHHSAYFRLQATAGILRDMQKMNKKTYNLIKTDNQLKADVQSDVIKRNEE